MQSQLSTKAFLSLLLAGALFLSPGCQPPAQPPKQNPPADTSLFDIANTHQILLTNEARFKNHTPLYGASAFLIHYRNGIYAVTARHLIGSDGGVTPQIQPAQLNRYFESWKLYPRVPVHPASDTVILSSPALNYNHLAHDILLLPVAVPARGILALQPSFSLPQKNETLFIVGCPYSEVDCRQNVYPVTYTAFDEKEASLVCASAVKLNLSGFSGAPLVTYNGKVVGVVTASGEEKGTFYIFATCINAIKEIQ